MSNDTLVDSLAPTVMSSPSGDARAVAPPADASFEGARYATRRVLGAGGMGEVRLCEDAWIGREVAMKVARPGAGGSASQTRGRFLREARVQGQLEHPSVVPVYDIGRIEGETFFTMKRVAGHTLEEIVSGLREGRADIVAKYNRRKLLAATSQVCLTIAYAHSRGVVHRDLKPANVMLGDFGEVYVLDWGVAKLAALEDAAGDAPPVDGDVRAAPPLEGGVRVAPPLEGGVHAAVTAVGSLIGTPGYMAPEQLQGEPATPRSDVYALGAMLFEALALEALNGGGSIEEILANTLRRPQAPSARSRAASVPPELDAIVLRATEPAPTDRFPSARAMQEAIEAYLDGERDAERRRELAGGHVERARAALARAVPGDAGEADRAEGMRELARAVALDPTDEGALHTIRELVLAPATDLPREAEEELRTAERRDRARASARAARMYIVWLGMVPLLVMMGVRSWPAIAVLVTLIVLASAFAQWVGISPGRARPGNLVVSMLLNFAVVASCSCIFGPFVFVPGVAASSAATFVLAVREKSWLRSIPFTLAILAVFLPLLLEHVGVLPRAYTFDGGVVTLHPFVASFRPASAAVSLGIVTFVQLLLPAVLINRAVDALVDAERRNFVQAWRLRRLLP